MKKIKLKNKTLEIKSCLRCPCSGVSNYGTYCSIISNTLFTSEQLIDYLRNKDNYLNSLGTLFPLEEPKSIWEIPDMCPLEDLK